jgi:hypothetical protein
MDYQHEATEEAFLSTLICCIVAIAPTIFFTGIMILWGYLIAKRQMTWRVWLASLIAIALRFFVAFGLRYMGWLEWLWIENLPHLAWQEWLIAIGIAIATFAAVLLPMRKASVSSGVFYITYMVASLIAGCMLLWW